MNIQNGIGMTLEVVMEAARTYLWGEKTSDLVDSLHANNKAVEKVLDSAYKRVTRIFNNVSIPINFDRLTNLADRIDELHAERQKLIDNIEEKKSKLEGRWYCLPFGSSWAKMAAITNGFFTITSWTFSTTANTIELFGDQDDMTLQTAKVLSKVAGDAFAGLTVIFAINWVSQELELKKLPVFVDPKDYLETYSLFLRNLKYLNEVHEKHDYKDKIQEMSAQLKSIQSFLGRQMKHEEEKYIGLVVYLAQDTCNFRPYLKELIDTAPSSSVSAPSKEGEEDTFDRVYAKKGKKPKGTFEGGRGKILTDRRKKTPWQKFDRYFGENRVNCLYDLETHKKIQRAAGVSL